MKSLLVEKILATERLGEKGFFEARGRVYTFLNPVSYLDALQHKELFGRFDGIFADGALLVAAIKMCYGISVSRRSFDMTSLAPKLLEYACKEGKNIYIVASAKEQVERAVEIFREIRSLPEDAPVPRRLLTLAAQVTDVNGAFFDARNAFKGCIAGIHEVLRRQGLMGGVWLLDENEGLSPGQKEEIDRVYRMYPDLNDDEFAAEFLRRNP